MVFNDKTKDQLKNDFLPALEDSSDIDLIQDWVRTTTSFDPANVDPNLIPVLWAAAGLNAEAGEVIGVLEKAMRRGMSLNEVRDKVRDELGDTIWFAFAVANALGVRIDDIVEDNISKINRRIYLGQISSEG